MYIPSGLVNAGSSDLISADVAIGGSFNGAPTYNLVAAIGDAKGVLTIRQLHGLTSGKLKRGCFDQVPHRCHQRLIMEGER
jgi:hypothetical protein